MSGWRADPGAMRSRGRGDKKAKGHVTVSIHPYVEVSVTVDRCNGLRNADGRALGRAVSPA